jgi:hypothetical protein
VVTHTGGRGGLPNWDAASRMKRLGACVSACALAYRLRWAVAEAPSGPISSRLLAGVHFSMVRASGATYTPLSACALQFH